MRIFVWILFLGSGKTHFIGINFKTKAILSQIGKFILENKDSSTIFTVKISEMRAKRYGLQ